MSVSDRDHDVVVVGSGYGGSVIAARLATCRRVLILERGRRWVSGEFPSGLAGVARQYITPRHPLGLWGMRFGRGTGNAFASGLGGASLVNYGLTVRPDDQLFSTWPVSAAEMAPYYERALEVLRPESDPTAGQLGDRQFLDLVEPGARRDLACTIDFSSCTRCGRCVPGCNEGAKRSLDRTYLPIALDAGAEVEVETEVVRLRERDRGYELLVRRTARPHESRTLRARLVVLAGGTFGTAELLHRSRRDLDLPRGFGAGAGMNADGVAFLYDTGRRLSGHCGAPIATSVRLRHRDRAGIDRGIMLLSGRIPAVAMRFGALILACGANLIGRWRGLPGGQTPALRAARRLADLFGAREEGALSSTFMFKVNGEDAAGGRIGFDCAGRAGIDWPDYGDDPVLRFAGGRLEDWARRTGGLLIPDPGSWRGMRSLGVHPVGGCRMGSNPAEGVVDRWCRLYRRDGTVHEGLRIADASALPGSPGVPPSLTVCALAERVAEHVLEKSRES